MSSATTQAAGSRMPFPHDEYEGRLEKLEAEYTRRGYETAVIWQRTGGSYDRAGDVYYLTNYASQSSGQEFSAGASQTGRSFAALLLRRGQEPELHITEPEHTVDRAYVAIGNIRDHHENLPRGFAERLVELGIEGRVAYLGDDFLPAQMYRQLLEGTPAIEWVAEEYLLRDVQYVKSERELDVYRETGEIATRSLTALMEGLIGGERQCDAVAKAAEIVIRAGGGFQRIACNTGAVSKDAMWDNPLYGFSERRAEPGDMVRGWVYGPINKGYWIDPGRSAVHGNNPTAGQRKLIEDTAELTEHLIAACKPGATPREVGILGDRFSAERGYGGDMGGAIWDIYGHSLSTFWLGPFVPSHGAESFEDDKGLWNVDRPFHDGQVYTIEAFLEEDGVGMASFEEVFIIWENGIERLTTTPMLFW